MATWITNLNIWATLAPSLVTSFRDQMVKTNKQRFRSDPGLTTIHKGFNLNKDNMLTKTKTIIQHKPIQRQQAKQNKGQMCGRLKVHVASCLHFGDLTCCGAWGGVINSTVVQPHVLLIFYWKPIHNTEAWPVVALEALSSISRPNPPRALSPAHWPNWPHLYFITQLDIWSREIQNINFLNTKSQSFCMI